MTHAKQGITALLLALIALFVAACGPSVEAEAVAKAEAIEPKCFIGEAEGTRVESKEDGGHTHWCCTLTCFTLSESSCPPGEQLTQFVPAPIAPEAVKGCEQASADGSDWCCKAGVAQ